MCTNSRTRPTPAIRAAYAPLDPDEYLYPPTFLPLPRLSLAATGDFFSLRRGWFAIEIVVWVLAFALVARFVGGREGRRVAFWSPVIWVAIPLLLTLQIGTVQLVAFALGMLALVAIESGRAAAGGLTLAVLVLGKVFPAILVLVLIARRRWRAVMWTVIGAIIVTGVAIWVVTPATFREPFSPAALAPQALVILQDLASIYGTPSDFAGLPAARWAGCCSGLPIANAALAHVPDERMGWRSTVLSFSGATRRTST